MKIGITILIVVSIAALVHIGHSADFQTWSDIATIYKISDNWRYDGDQGVRGVLSQNDFTLLYFRPFVRYRARPWFTAHGGIRFFKTFCRMGGRLKMIYSGARLALKNTYYACVYFTDLIEGTEEN